MTWYEVAITALLTGLLGGSTVTKLLNYKIDKATAKKTDVETLRSIIDEVKESDAAKGTLIRQLTTRISQLEERERHMLTRAAVHEAWDQMAFSMLIAQNPEHPPPPPLTQRKDRLAEDDTDA